MKTVHASRAQVRAVAAIAAAACAASASAAFSTASYEPCGSTEGLGSFHADLTYSYVGGATATITITLTNSTEVSLGGYITALAINYSSTASGVGFLSSSSAAFTDIMAPISASPYGMFAAGAGLGGSFLGSGDPGGGIAVGGSETFTFVLSGSAAALAALDAETVLTPDAGYAMVVRFRGGAVDDWSDKVVGCPLPAPGALALLGAVGLVSKRRRRV